MKTRFSKFFNLPELINMFKEVADIKTADMLNLPVPNAHYQNVAVKPSDIQKELVESLGERAQKLEMEQLILMRIICLKLRTMEENWHLIKGLSMNFYQKIKIARSMPVLKYIEDIS